MNLSSCKKATMRWVLMTAVFGVLQNSPVLASPIGLPDENTARIGYLVGASRLDVDDPDGPTKASVEVIPLNLIYTDWLPHSWRYWTEAYYLKTTLDADPGDIKQNVTRIGARLTLQRNVDFGRWSLWFGGGLDVSRNKYSRRYTVDSGGFLLNTYADRSDTAVGVVTQLVIDWPVAQNWDIAAKLGHVFSVSGGITESGLYTGILYRY